MAYGTFTLTGTHQDITTGPHAGKVVIAPNAVIRDSVGNVILSGAKEVTLDTLGHWSVVLPADDPSLNPASGIGYRVTYRLHSSSLPSEFVAAQPAGTTLDMADVVSSNPTTATTTLVGPGVAAGGTTGQALVKQSDADYDTAWTTVSGTGGSAPDATTTVKGIVRLAGDLGGTALLPTVPGLAGKAATVHTHAPADVTGTAVITTDPRLSDARTPTAHTHPASQISDSTATGRAVVTATDAAAARTSIGAGTSSFSGAYTDLTGKPTLGTAAATDATAYATAAQGAKADTALQPTTAQAVNAQTGTTYTLVAGDAGKLVTLSNAAAITLTVPSATFTAGQRVDFLVLGGGMVTVVGSGVTVNGTPSLVSRAQYSAASVVFLSGTSAVVVGDLA